jgi:DNA mismatch repair protein MutS
LHNHKDYKPKTLFATHYHELNQLEEDLVRVKNFNVSVKEAGDKIIFMRTLKAGGSEHSFGIHVAHNWQACPTKWCYAQTKYSIS